MALAAGQTTRMVLSSGFYFIRLFFGLVLKAKAPNGFMKIFFKKQYVEIKTNAKPKKISLQNKSSLTVASA